MYQLGSGAPENPIAFPSDEVETSRKGKADEKQE
jgi:hypothetical protein